MKALAIIMALALIVMAAGASAQSAPFFVTVKVNPSVIGANVPITVTNMQTGAVINTQLNAFGEQNVNIEANVYDRIQVKVLDQSKEMVVLPDRVGNPMITSFEFTFDYVPPVVEPVVCPVCDACQICQTCETCEVCEEPPVCPVVPADNSTLFAAIGAIVGAAGGATVVRKYASKLVSGKSNGVRFETSSTGVISVYHKHSGVVGYHSSDTIHASPISHPKGMLNCGTHYVKNAKGAWEYI